MKIAVWHNLASGGAKRALYEQVKRLVQRGHAVSVWCPSSADTQFLPLATLAHEHVVPFAHRDPPASGRMGNLMYPYRAVKSLLDAVKRNCAECAEQILRGGFDVAFVHPCQFFRVPAIGAMLRTLPSVLYLHEPDRKTYEALPTLPWLAPTLLDDGPMRPGKIRQAFRGWVKMQGLQLRANAERRNAESFGRILVNSYFTRESVLRAYGLDCTVCYLGISADVFRVADGPRERFVIGLGSFTYEKGVDIAVRAIATIDAPLRPRLVWVGNVASHPYYEETSELAASLGVDLDARIRIPDDEVARLLGRAAVMLYTSRLEPFGLAPLEANACGTPVVAVAEGGVRETIRPMVNGLLVDDRDPVGLGHALLRVLDDPELARRLGEGGRAEVATRWSWDASVDRLEGNLRDAVTLSNTGPPQVKDDVRPTGAAPPMRRERTGE